MRVAIVAFYFPPDGGAGTQRPAAWARYLAGHGIDATIYTRSIASDESRSRYEPRDESLVGWVSVAKVRRLEWKPGRAEADQWRTSVAEAIVEDHRAEPFDLVVVTAPPFELVPFGGEVARRLDRPLVVDLRDAWALDGIRPATHWFAHRRDLDLMRRSLGVASGLLTTSDAATRAVDRLLAGSVPIATVTNGFEPEDFSGAAPGPRGDREFRITFAGQFLSWDAVPPRNLKERIRRFVQARAVPIDPTGRSPLHVLEAIRRLRERDPELGRRIRFDFAGVVDSATATVIERSGVADAVTAHGYLPHAEVIRRIREADALFIGLNGMPAGEEPLVIPGKLFEYLAARRPILAALPPGDARRLVLAHADSVAVDPCDPEAIARGIARIASGDLDSRQGGMGIERFTRAALAGDVARFLKETLERTRPARTIPA